MAAADCAEGLGPPPPALTLAWECSKWNSLPYPGALGDQPYGLMANLSAVTNVYDVMHAWNMAPNTARIEWPMKYPSRWGILQNVILLRENYGR